MTSPSVTAGRIRCWSTSLSALQLRSMIESIRNRLVWVWSVAWVIGLARPEVGNQPRYDAEEELGQKPEEEDGHRVDDDPEHPPADVDRRVAEAAGDSPTRTPTMIATNIAKKVSSSVAAPFTRMMSLIGRRSVIVVPKSPRSDVPEVLHVLLVERLVEAELVLDLVDHRLAARGRPARPRSGRRARPASAGRRTSAGSDHRHDQREPGQRVALERCSLAGGHEPPMLDESCRGAPGAPAGAPRQRRNSSDFEISQNRMLNADPASCRCRGRCSGRPRPSSPASTG